ncbi:arrestin domain-containing protein 3-like isoform X2 [Mercenaria mercenaria]|uniref:arrestin domain-containing protein 3-like isoform X2 n=1 Tax=Mercenaria mercenaria TaxID=6596 RepID=UPI00234E9E6C|nr:arrestin domain-containing protein 3-like isoform X2 [Mercenaria mercenaria]
MTRLRKFEIVLSNRQVVYFPGQCVQGHLIVELDEAMEMRGIFLRCQGKGHVQWKAGKHHVTASEDYLNVCLKLFGNDPQQGDHVTLNAGNHAFPFQIVLPVNAPGSFEGLENCFVRYFLKATIDRPWKFDKHYKMVFTVASVLDLNTVLNAAAPAQTEDAKTVCCMCCESDPVSATFRIDKIGCVPGESIVFDAEIKDGTGRGINSSVVKFIMLTVYKAYSGAEREIKREIGRLHHGTVSPGGSDVWRRERLRIPPVPPSFLPNCNLIEIHYIIEMVVDVADTPFDLHLPLSVVIGTIPLQSVVQQIRPQEQPGAITEQPQASGASGFSEDIPPPSYRECVLGRVDTMDEDEQYAAGDRNFAPAYTYYDFV